MRKYLTVERTCRGKTVVRKRGGRASLARKGRDGFTAVDSTWDLVGLGSFDAQRDLICDGDAVAFQRDDFFGMVGENPNVSEAEVDQDLRAYSAFVLHQDRKSTRLNSSHGYISYAVFCLKKKKNEHTHFYND